jgi:hypothetical protein
MTPEVTFWLSVLGATWFATFLLLCREKYRCNQLWTELSRKEAELYVIEARIDYIQEQLQGIKVPAVPPFVELTD